MSSNAVEDSGARVTKRQKKAEAFRRGDRKRKKPEPSALPEMDEEGAEEAPKVEKKKKPKAPARFIVFVGNLPFDATAEHLKEHFGSAGPVKSVRLMTDKITKKPKGFAFVEFGTAIALGHALHMHHTQYRGREMNVELTAGGGGGGEARRNKFREKNEKLDEEREKYAKKKSEEENKPAPSRRGVKGGKAKVHVSPAQSSYKPTGANAENAGYGQKRTFPSS